ncbi:GNAT family N-acetyltransferase [Nocardioides islandensis]|uniref:GNAT family N-acetyltransferase n=1 Tax=Nocardioides islandensis TaxID=433663 RepID=A0A930VJ55_9ACTN|nr:GNAT family N-acetyltransferase [Nocardioides islandensis]MBF4765803.1 GNAT family N-acetyltransferase [Nocardioides islandensis]
MTTRRTHDRSTVAELIAAMTAWPHPDRVAAGLHVGDLGWHLRLDDDALENAFVGWWEGDDLQAVALLEDVVGRFAVRPGLERDAALGEQLAAECRWLADTHRGDAVYAELRAEAAARRILVGEGWSLDPEPWVALHADLDRWQPRVDLDGVSLEAAADAVAERVAVQRAGFENSTFTAEAWSRLAAGPAYRRDLDVVLRADGEAVAIGTAWLAGEGATAILEPVATHQDHRGRGFGVRVVTALISRLRHLGASGVTVCTPLDYTGAIATYRAAGLAPVEHLSSLVGQSAR